MASDSAKKQDQIDMKLALKALPGNVDENNMNRCVLFNFGEVKKSLIAFHNDDQDELFKYYDNKNKTRLHKLNNKAGVTKDLTHSLKELGSSVLSILTKIQNTGIKKGKQDANARYKGDKDMDGNDLPELMNIRLQEPHAHEHD
jgi:hypothetical protein